MAEITLNDDFPLFGRAAHAAACLEEASEGCLVIVGTDEATHEGDGFAATMVLFHADAESLLRLGRGGYFGLGFTLVVKIGIGGEYDSQTVFPVGHRNEVVLKHCKGIKKC